MRRREMSVHKTEAHFQFGRVHLLTWTWEDAGHQVEPQQKTEVRVEIYL